MVWWNPTSWFSRNAAKSMINAANTDTLKTALKNYVNAVNKLNNKNNAFIYGLLMKTKEGTDASYKNRIVNGVAKIVAASRRTLPKVMNDVVNGQPEGEAAAKVNNVTNKIKNLNAFMNTIKAGNTATQLSAYITGARNASKNRALDAGRGAKYSSLFNAINMAMLNKKILNINSQLPKGSTITNANRAMMYTSKYSSNYIRNKAINKNGKYAGLWAAIAAQQPPAQPSAPAAVNNRFKNMNINALVNSAAQSMAMSNENKAKLKAAMNAKINTLNENSMNRVRLVNATRNLN